MIPHNNSRKLGAVVILFVSTTLQQRKLGHCVALNLYEDIQVTVE